MNEKINFRYLICLNEFDEYSHLAARKPVEILALLPTRQIFNHTPLKAMEQVNDWLQDHFNEDDYILTTLHEMEKRTTNSIHLPVIFIYDKSISMAIKLMYDGINY